MEQLEIAVLIASTQGGRNPVVNLQSVSITQIQTTIRTLPLLLFQQVRRFGGVSGCVPCRMVQYIHSPSNGLLAPRTLTWRRIGV